MATYDRHRNNSWRHTIQRKFVQSLIAFHTILTICLLLWRKITLINMLVNIVRRWYNTKKKRERYVLWNNGRIGETYLVSSENEMSNIEIVNKILSILDVSNNLIKHVSDRPGHDKRYALSPDKIKKELGWSPRNNFDDALRKTINHYRENISKYTIIWRTFSSDWSEWW